MESLIVRIRENNRKINICDVQERIYKLDAAGAGRLMGDDMLVKKKKEYSDGSVNG